MRFQDKWHTESRWEFNIITILIKKNLNTYYLNYFSLFYGTREKRNRLIFGGLLICHPLTRYNSLYWTYEIKMSCCRRCFCSFWSVRNNTILLVCFVHFCENSQLHEDNRACLKICSCTRKRKVFINRISFAHWHAEKDYY